MRSNLLLQVFIFTTTRYALALPEDTRVASSNGPKRQLRVSQAPDEDERGVISSIKSSVKTTYWAQTLKSDDYVKKALKLNGLSESALKYSPNYKQYQNYLYKAEGVHMDSWVIDKVNPTTIWNKVGLKTMSAGSSEKAAALKTYERYATKYDGKVYGSEYKTYEPSSEAEMNVLLKIWGKTARPDSYVLRRLGVYTDKDRYYSHAYHQMVSRYPTKAEIKAHPNYSKFQAFLGYKKKYY